jgi:hypothetical protein
MTGPLHVKRCMFCNRIRTGEHWALGLDALLEEDRVGWLCDECEARPGRGWEFVDVVRALYPAAVVVSCTAYAERLVRSPLVLPGPEPDGPSAPRRARRLDIGRLLPTKPAD